MILTDAAALVQTDASADGRVVIIGAGAVGIFLAAQLDRLGRESVIIEAGDFALNSFDPESFASVGRPNEGLRIGRSRAVGGTTNLWGGQLVEFQPADFAGRDWIPGSRWPVSYEQVAAHYPQTYERLGILAAQQSDQAVLRSIGATAPSLGDGLEYFLTRWMRVPNFARLFESTLRGSPRVRLLTGFAAVGFDASLLDPSRVLAVRVADRSGRRSTIRGDQFVLAAGTVEISRLLLTAAADPSWICPWRHNPNVGAYFQDHLCGRVGSLRPLNKKVFFRTFATIARGPDKYQPKIRLTSEALAGAPLYNTQGIVLFENSVSEHLVFLKQFLRAATSGRRIGSLGDILRGLGPAFRYLPPLAWRYLVEHRVFVPSGSQVFLSAQCEHGPTSGSRIRIDPHRRDALGLPATILDWQLRGDELPSILQFAIRADRALRAAGLAELDIDPDLRELKPSFLNTMKDVYHQSGGAVMGESERDGVVDQDLRVFGTRNLSVAGSAVFRTTSNANTTFNALALASRLADHLGQLRRV